MGEIEWSVDGPVRRITPVHDERELGAHADYTKRGVTGTMRARLENGCVTTDTIAGIPDRKRRVQLVATVAHPVSLYSCESTNVPDDSLRKYMASTVKAIDGVGHMGRSLAMTYLFTDDAGTDLDPEVEILARRVLAIR